jgi:hypothetical protein
LRLGNIDRFITKRIGRKEESSRKSSDVTNRGSSILRGNWIIIIVGIAIAAIGFAGTIFYGSQFVKEEVNAGGELPFTTPSKINSVLPIDLEVVFVVIGVIGFGIFIYGFATRVDKPLDFYPV